MIKQDNQPKPRAPDDTSLLVTLTAKISETEARIVEKRGDYKSDSPSVFRALAKWTPPPEVFGVYASGNREDGLPVDGNVSCSLEDDGYEPGAEADADDSSSIGVSAWEEVTRKDRKVDFHPVNPNLPRLQLDIGRGFTMPHTVEDGGPLVSRPV